MSNKCKITFKHNKNGYFELMKSEECQALLQQYGEQVLNNANSVSEAQYEMTEGVGTTRANVKVRTTDIRSIKSNLKHNTLLKALGV